MSMNLDVIEEPTLIFGGGARYVDPKLGLLQAGPFGVSADPVKDLQVVRVGAIGTIPTLSRLRQFLQTLRHRISSAEDSPTHPWIVDFPGLSGNSRLRFDIRLDEDKVETIWPEEEAKALASANRLDRIENTVQLYERKVHSLIEASGVHTPQLLLLPISAETMASCRDPTQEQEKIVYHRRTMSRRRARVPEDFPLLDFHDVLKVIGIQHHVPVQVIRPATLGFKGQGLQDPATIAWNFSVAAFYKGTGSPWKLADLSENTCYVGISFYVEVGIESHLRAAMAQVYLRTGESQIIRGKPFRWTDPRHRSPILTEQQASEILDDVIELYEKQWRKKPSRVVIHKTSQFRGSEIDGFETSAKGVDQLDLVHVYETSQVRLYHLSNDYPPVRGTLLWADGEPDGVLYTNGFIKGLGTYPGSTVPWPLRFSCDRLDSSVKSVAADIMALTKLDWNNTNFNTSLPVTLSVAEKVGEILSETRARQLNPPQGYRFYM